MEPVLLNRKEIDTVLWNRCIDHARFSCLYAYSWYLDAVSPGWKALVSTVENGYMIVMPVPIRNKWFLKVVSQPFYCQYLGIFSPEKIPEEVIAVFLSKFTREFWYVSGYSFHPAHDSFLLSALSQQYQFTVQLLTTHWLEIPEDKTPFSYTPDRIVNLKRSYRCNWELSDSDDISPLIRLFDENHLTNFENGIHHDSYKWLARLATLLLQHKMARLWYAVSDGTVHAGILVAYTAGKHYYLFNAADEKGRKGNARTWLLDQYFRQTGAGAHTFDFESPEVKNIADYYRSFGAEPIRFISVRKNGLPRPFRWFQEWRIKRSRKIKTS